MPTSHRLLSVVTAVLSACACAGISPVPALAAAQAARESVGVFEAQLNGHQVRGVTVHTQAHDFRVKLKDGRKVTVAFPAAEQQRLLDEVRARGVAVKVPKVQPPSHKRRDIAIGAAVAIVIVVLGVAARLFVRRRRLHEEEYGPGAR